MPETALHKIAYEGDMAGAENLLEENTDSVDFNAPGAQKRTPLMRAADAGRSAMAEWLVGKGAGINIEDASGRTALHWAAIAGHDETCKKLLEMGIDPNKQTKSGMTGFHCAVDGDKVSTLGMFLDWNKAATAKVDVNLTNTDGKTALQMAIDKKSKVMVNKMKEGGMDVPSGACILM